MVEISPSGTNEQVLVPVSVEIFNEGGDVLINRILSQDLNVMGLEAFFFLEINAGWYFCRSAKEDILLSVSIQVSYGQCRAPVGHLVGDEFDHVEIIVIVLQVLEIQPQVVGNFCVVRSGQMTLIESITAVFPYPKWTMGSEED